MNSTSNNTSHVTLEFSPVNLKLLTFVNSLMSANPLAAEQAGEVTKKDPTLIVARTNERGEFYLWFLLQRGVNHIQQP